MAKKKKKKSKNLLKNKAIVIFIIAVLLVGFTLFVMKMVDNIFPEKVKVKLETNVGDIVIELYSDMPITAGNFENPTGTGMGGPGYQIEDEFVEGHSNIRGTIAMANSGPNSGGSQFFINVADNTFLDWDKEPSTSKHPVFGEVVEGMDIVAGISEAATSSGDKPIQEIKIVKATII